MAKKKRVFFRRLVTILVCLVFISFFSWVDHNSGMFEWWHVGVLLGVMVLSLISSLGIPKKLWTWLNNIRNFVLRYVGFDKESWDEGRGVRREYFMALVPISFIISVYLIQAAIKNNNIDIIPLLLSLLILGFALNLVAISFTRMASVKWISFTNSVASWMSFLGSMVFAHDLFIATGDLMNTNVSPVLVYIFLVAGLVGVFAIILFFFIVMFGRELAQEKV